MSNNIRIRTTPLGNDNYVKLKLEQDFDFIEILSLKLSQDKVYDNFCSDYGVIVGRVSINGGFGVPNAKVGIFIPVDTIDKENAKIFALYPYETVESKNIDGIRYNLLSNESDGLDDCYTPVGTLPSKREILDNEDLSYIYCKYYKFTTTTNDSGDFMLFGVPVGAHTLHIDADISNIGRISQKPFNLIEQGVSRKAFNSTTKFKDGKNLNELIQVKTSNVGINVQPFWGNLEQCEIGINRVDIDLNFTFTPSAFFIGGVYGDSNKNSYNKRCRPRKDIGKLDDQMTQAGTIEMLIKNKDGTNQRFDIEGGELINDKGAWAYMIPCNLDYVVTDEFGNVIPSEDETKGIPTRVRARFRVGMGQSEGAGGRLRARGKYLVPHNPNNTSELDFSFDKTTKDSSFTDLYWNKVYTVKNFIPRTQKSGSRRKVQAYSGIKDTDNAGGDKEQMPYNRAYTKGSPIFTYICLILSLLVGIVCILNTFLCTLRKVCFFRICPFKWVPRIGLQCPVNEQLYFPCCDGEPSASFVQCVSAGLAEGLNMFSLDFYSDWVNGSLYYPLFKYKRKRNRKAKFCEYYCNSFENLAPRPPGDNKCYQNQIVDSTYENDRDLQYKSFTNGLMVKYDDDLYYSPLLIDNSGFKLYATDVVNLGSVFDCDWQGFPKIINYLPTTTFNLPPITQESDDDGAESGIISVKGDNGVGLFFGVDCSGLYHSKNNCTNIRRMCELFVEVPSCDGAGCQPSGSIGILEIYNPNDSDDYLTSISRYTRDVFALLNVDGSGIRNFPGSLNRIIPQPSQSNLNASFGIGATNNEDHNNGDLYNEFRNFFKPHNDNDIAFQSHGGSFYFYFGLIAGATGLDLFKSKYLAPCERVNRDEYIIDTTITCTSDRGLSDGKIDIKFLGGTTPFTYEIVGPTTNIGPLQTSSVATITGLAKGSYLIKATDGKKKLATKQVEMCDPLGVSCIILQEKEQECINNPDGKISFNIYNGKPPYTIVSNPSLPIPQNQTSGTITNVAAGTYKFTVTDGYGDVCETDVILDGPIPLGLTINSIENVTCDATNDGLIDINFSGGTSPYKIKVSRSANEYDGNSYEKIQDSTSYSPFSDLYPGVYTVTLTDSSIGCNPQNSITRQVTVNKIIPPILDFRNLENENKKQCDPTKYTLKFFASQGIPTRSLDLPTPPSFNLNVTIDGQNVPSLNRTIQQNGVQTLTVTQNIVLFISFEITDKNNCIAENKLFEPAIRKPKVPLELQGVRDINVNTPTSIPSVSNGCGEITWTYVADTDWTPFLPLVIAPVDPTGTATFPASQPPFKYLTYTSGTPLGCRPVVGTITNGVGCTATFNVSV